MVIVSRALILCCNHIRPCLYYRLLYSEILSTDKMPPDVDDVAPNWVTILCVFSLLQISISGVEGRYVRLVAPNWASGATSRT